MAGRRSNKTDQILDDLTSVPNNCAFIPNDSPLWPHFARLAAAGVLDVVRTDRGVAAVKLKPGLSPVEIGKRRNVLDESALDSLAEMGGDIWEGEDNPHKAAFRRLAKMGIVYRRLELPPNAPPFTQAEFRVTAVGVGYFPAPKRSQILRIH